MEKREKKQSDIIMVGYMVSSVRNVERYVTWWSRPGDTGNASSPPHSHREKRKKRSGDRCPVSWSRARISLGCTRGGWPGNGTAAARASEGGSLNGEGMGRERTRDGRSTTERW